MSKLQNTSKENDDSSSHDEISEKLSVEDQKRVAKYLRSPIHSVDRKPFRPYLMMLALIVVVVLLGLLSRLITHIVLG